MLGMYLIMAAIAKQQGWDLDKIALEAQDAYTAYQGGLWIDPDNGVDFLTAQSVQSGPYWQLVSGKLDVPWDFSTKLYHSGYIINNQPRNPSGGYSVFVRPGRSQVFYIGGDTYLTRATTNTSLTSFTYSTEYNHNTTVNSGWSIRGFFYSPDGYKLYLAGWNGGNRQVQLIEQTLSSPYLLNGTTTANTVYSLDSYTSGLAGGMYIAPDGKSLFFYTGNNAQHHFWKFEMTTPWDFTTLSSTFTQRRDVSTPSSGAGGIWAKPDGKKLFTLTYSANNILTWSMT